MKKIETTKNSNDSILVPFSKVAKKEVLRKIREHYGEEANEKWQRVETKYYEFLKEWNKDLGGKKNFHNVKGGTYDCILILTYYVVCKEKTFFREIEELEENLILPSFEKMKFVDCNKAIWKKTLYRAFNVAQKKCDKWQDYKMEVLPYKKKQPIRYFFHSCPVAEFARRFGLEDIMPALCNVDFKSMALLKAKLVRFHTCVESDSCDYTIYGDKEAISPQEERQK